MANKVIRFALSEKEIDGAIKELEKYKEEIAAKTNLLRERVAQRIRDLADSAFSSALIDDLLRGSARAAQVEVDVTNEGNISLVIASGEDAIWAEFGAGVYHNGSAGASPHPKGSEFGFTIGGYGYGQGKKAVWGFYEGDELMLTHGAPASMPMYRSVQWVCNEIYKIAKEVFK